MLRRAVGGVIISLFCRPPHVKYSAQTVYKALQGCLYLQKAAIGDTWKPRAKTLTKLLLQIQKEDGGFDVGYDYPFGVGNTHRKGESLACESTALLTLVQISDSLRSVATCDAVRRAVAWILKHATQRDSRTWAIPYSPDTSADTVIINATSFAAAALGVAASGMKDGERSRAVYEGMIRYLDGKMQRDDDLPGRFWYYCDPEWNPRVNPYRDKIDYYHQAMQVEVHAIAQQVNPLPLQRQMIEDGADHLVAVHRRDGVMPYDNAGYFAGLIHTWGLSSVVPAMIEAARVIPDRCGDYHGVAHETMRWILEHAWNGDYFYDILTPEGKPVSADYMVRSDAWCFQAMAAYTLAFGAGIWTDVAERCFSKMKAADFSGPEKHGKRRVQQFFERYQRHEGSLVSQKCP